MINVDRERGTMDEEELLAFEVWKLWPVLFFSMEKQGMGWFWMTKQKQSIFRRDIFTLWKKIRDHVN